MTAEAEGPFGTRPAPAALPRQLRILRPLADRTGEERVLRVTALGFLPGTVIFGLLAVSDIRAQATDYPAWWTTVVIAGLLVAPMVMGAISFAAPIRVLRALAAVSAATALLAQLTLPVVIVPGRTVPHGGAPWIDDVASMAVIVSLLAVRPVWAVLIAFSAACMTVVDRWAVTPGHSVLTGVQNGLYVFLFCITFIALGVMTFHGVREADLAEAAALEAATSAAAEAARERERGRINALVHDRVLATLLAAARSVPGSETLRRADAARALEGLQRLLVAGDEPGDRARRGGVRLVDPGDHHRARPRCRVRLRGARSAPHPRSRGRGPHGGHRGGAAQLRPARRARATARCTCTSTRTVPAIDVLDDGVGFEPDRVPPARLGISESIRGRMEALPGGSAVVVSTPGVGTRVQLRYRPEER